MQILADLPREGPGTWFKTLVQLKRQGVANGGMNIITNIKGIGKLYVNKNGLMSLAARYDKDFFAIDFVVADEITRTAHAVPEGHWLAFVARYKVNAGMGKVHVARVTHPDGTIEETDRGETDN